ncbi:hypothetical protein J6590_015707 [Homalodisca vitripennis]|nr:hypothetical protein J6590_015707 [Homalodisca vitripennis]
MREVIIFSYQEIAPGVYDCWATFPFPWGERVYVTWYSVSVFLVPLFVLIYTYFCICWTLWRYSGLPDSSSPHHLISRAKINTIKQTVAVILLYISCSSPFICAQLWASWGPRQPFFDGAAFTILSLLSSLNSCVNPWIYLSFNRELLRSLWRASICTGSPRHRNLRGSASSCRRVTEMTTTSAGDTIAAADNRHWCDSLDYQSSSDKHSSLKSYRMQDSSSFPNRRLSKICQPAREVCLTPML